MNIESIYQLLKEEGICRNDREFSEQLLSQSEGYYRIIKHRGGTPSLKALYQLENKIGQLPNVMCSAKCLEAINDIREEILTE